jgi:hypothetical protein
MAVEGASGGAVEAATLVADAAPDVAAVGDRRVLAGDRWDGGGGAAARGQRSAGGARGGVLAAQLSGARAAALEMGRRRWSDGARAEECRRRAWRSAGGAGRARRRRGPVELWRRRWSSGGGAGASGGGATSGSRGWRDQGEEKEQGRRGRRQRWCRGDGAWCWRLGEGEKKTGSIPYWNNRNPNPTLGWACI